MAECCRERDALLERFRQRQSSGPAIRRECRVMLARPLAANDLFAAFERLESVRSWLAAAEEEVACRYNPPDERLAWRELAACLAAELAATSSA